ncbi:4-hydroxy-tetrahydrodipicolinate reductase [Alphaproteobacteria bacterium]|nr:4-hydroxy-tetrahydrodipicolinate reductase [Alphaproteobacteria bacterium]
MKIVINGCAGRMGRSLLHLATAHNDIDLVGGLEPKGSPAIGQDLGTLMGGPDLGILVTDDPLTTLKDADGVIDFTIPQASLEIAAIAAQARIAHIIGTTGFTPDQETELLAAARHATIVKSGNMSLGVNLLAVLVKQAAKSLNVDWDIEILDMHHRHKVDAPSGTALLLGEAAAQGRNVDLKTARIAQRDGISDPRAPGAIGFSALRGGSVVGDHDVIFAGDNEQIRLSHRAESRDIFAQGAVKAALWAQNKEPGLYSMQDVLGLSEE